MSVIVNQDTDNISVDINS